jgi:threonine dehydrogenase-like Zn-dependent dehydrogenase
MKAVVYNGPRDVAVADVDDARLERPSDAHDPQGHEIPNDTLNKLVSSVRFTGGIGVVGVFVPEDPGSDDEFAQPPFIVSHHLPLDQAPDGYEPR